MTSLKTDMRTPVLVCGPMKFLLIKLWLGVLFKTRDQAC